MSSRRCERHCRSPSAVLRRCGCSRTFVGAQGGEDGVGEPSAEQPNRFGASLAAAQERVEAAAAGPDAAGLGHRDHVQGAVRGPVTSPVEPDLPGGVARPDRNRGNQVAARKNLFLA